MSSMFSKLKKLYDLIDGFVLVMLTAIGIALLAPEFGSSRGPLHLGIVTSLGVALVFFLHGAALSREKLVSGAKHWRLHVFVQTFTYVVFPVVGLLLMLSLRNTLPADLLLGVFYLCALPSTVSSSVAMTSMARGNVSGAIFNATISGLIGMAVTPLLMGLVISASGASMPLGKALTGVALQLLLPFALGQLLRPLIGSWLAKKKHITNKIDRGVIVLIVYSSFCDATAEGLWHHYQWQTIAAVMGLAAVLLFVVLGTTTFVARVWGSVSKTRSPPCSAARRRAWPTASRCKHPVRRPSGAGAAGAAADGLSPVAAHRVLGDCRAVCESRCAGGGSGCGAGLRSKARMKKRGKHPPFLLSAPRPVTPTDS